MRRLGIEMQGVALLQQHPLTHEIHFHLACVNKQELFALVFLERGVAELGRRLNQKRQQAALANLTGEGRVPGPCPSPTKAWRSVRRTRL